MSEPAGQGPFLLLAALAQAVTFGDDGQLTGMGEMIGHLHIGGEGPEAPDRMPQVKASLQAIVILVAGQGQGKRFTLAVQPEDPSGKRQLRVDFPFEFQDAEQAIANIPIGLNLELHEEGTYWIDVILAPRGSDGEERPLTKIPLEVSYQRSDA